MKLETALAHLGNLNNTVAHVEAEHGLGLTGFVFAFVLQDIPALDAQASQTPVLRQELQRHPLRHNPDLCGLGVALSGIAGSLGLLKSLQWLADNGLALDLPHLSNPVRHVNPLAWSFHSTEPGCALAVAQWLLEREGAALLRTPAIDGKSLWRMALEKGRADLVGWMLQRDDSLLDETLELDHCRGCEVDAVEYACIMAPRGSVAPDLLRSARAARAARQAIEPLQLAAGGEPS